MSKFYRDVLTRQELENDTALVTVKSALKLIENSEFYDDLIRLFNINDRMEEVIAIPGLNKVIQKISFKDSQYEKFDHDINLVDVSLNGFTEDGAALLNIRLRKSSSDDDGTIIIAETAYNSKSDYFDSGYKLEAYSKFCFQQGHIKLLKDNIEYLNEHYQNSNNYDRNFRLLKDQDGKYYVRAITSISHYNNYGIRFSLFVAIVSLNGLLNKDWHLKIIKAEYDESTIKVFFEKSGVKKIKGIGEVKFIIELSNDEIKREAMKFSAAFSIINDEFEIYAKPQKLKTELLSIQHNFSPETVFKYLSSLNEFIEKSEEEVLADINDLNNVQNPDELRYLLLQKVEKAKNEDVKENRAVIAKLLQNRINTMSDLLILMSKVDLIVSRLESKEYLRYMFYDVLKGKK